MAWKVTQHRILGRTTEPQIFPSTAVLRAGNPQMQQNLRLKPLTDIEEWQIRSRTGYSPICLEARAFLCRSSGAQLRGSA